MLNQMSMTIYCVVQLRKYFIFTALVANFDAWAVFHVQMLTVHYYLLFDRADGLWHHTKTFYNEGSTFRYFASTCNAFLKCQVVFLDFHCYFSIQMLWACPAPTFTKGSS